MADHHHHQVEKRKNVSLMDKIHGNDSSPSNSEDERTTSLKGKVHPLFGRDKPVHKVLGGVKEKTQMAKQKNSSTCRRGDKRNSRGQKNKCDSFSLKNGLVGFNSAAGGANFFGIYGLKPDVFDITKYVEELSLDELLHGSYNYPSIAKDKGKKAANSNNNLLQSVRKACSLLQDQKVLQSQKIVDIDNSCIDRVSTALVTASSAAGQIEDDRGDNCTSDMPSPDKVQESGDNMKTPPAADSPLYHPKDLLERLALPPPKDLDLLLSDAGKTTSSKNCPDPRSGKSVSNRTGLPPFPWSNSFSGHNKMGAEAIKLSASRIVCSGRWEKINNSTTQKGSADLLVDFESLTFNQSLVPSVTVMSEHPEKKIAPSERALAASGECSTSKVLTDDHSPTHAAAQTLLDLANETSSATVKMLKKPSQMSMKACKLKAVERSDKLFDAPKPLTRPLKHVRFGDGFPPKKPRLGSTNSPSFPKRYRDSSYMELATAWRLLGPGVPRWGNS